MKLLGIDSSARAASAAVMEDGRLLCENYVDVGLTHSETLMPMVEAMLLASGLKFADIEQLAVAAGPGSFTGLRIGIAAVKGLAFARNLPCTPVSTLEALAYNLLGRNCIACAVMDARCQQVYMACFRTGGDTVERLCSDEAITIVTLGERLTALQKEHKLPIVLVGDGAELCYHAIGEQISACLAPPHLRRQHASGVCMASQHGTAVTSDELLPAYLRLPQAERELLKREGKME